MHCICYIHFRWYNQETEQCIFETVVPRKDDSLLLFKSLKRSIFTFFQTSSLVVVSSLKNKSKEWCQHQTTQSLRNKLYLTFSWLSFSTTITTIFPQMLKWVTLKSHCKQPILSLGYEVSLWSVILFNCFVGIGYLMLISYYIDSIFSENFKTLSIEIATAFCYILLPIIFQR